RISSRNGVAKGSCVCWPTSSRTPGFASTASIPARYARTCVCRPILQRIATCCRHLNRSWVLICICLGPIARASTAGLSSANRRPAGPFSTRARPTAWRYPSFASAIVACRCLPLEPCARIKRCHLLIRQRPMAASRQVARQLEICKPDLYHATHLQPAAFKQRAYGCASMSPRRFHEKPSVSAFPTCVLDAVELDDDIVVLNDARNALKRKVGMRHESTDHVRCRQRRGAPAQRIGEATVVREHQQAAIAC